MARAGAAAGAADPAGPGLPRLPPTASHRPRAPTPPATRALSDRTGPAAARAVTRQAAKIPVPHCRRPPPPPRHGRHRQPGRDRPGRWRERSRVGWVGGRGSDAGDGTGGDGRRGPGDAWTVAAGPAVPGGARPPSASSASAVARIRRPRRRERGPACLSACVSRPLPARPCPPGPRRARRPGGSPAPGHGLKLPLRVFPARRPQRPGLLHAAVTVTKAALAEPARLRAASAPNQAQPGQSNGDTGSGLYGLGCRSPLALEA